MNPVSLGGRRGLEGIKFCWEAEGIQWEAYWEAMRLQRAREQMRAWLWGVAFPIPWFQSAGIAMGGGGVGGDATVIVAMGTNGSPRVGGSGAGGGWALGSANNVIITGNTFMSGGGVGSGKRWIEVQGAKIVESTGEM